MIIIPDDLPAINTAIIRRAQLDIPIIENPPSSNRSPEIDAMCRRWGVPLASYWCALWAASVWADAGAAVPPIAMSRDWHPAKCQTWYEWSLQENLFTSEPTLGCAVLYGNNGHEPAEHIGTCIVAMAPAKFDLEGNTSLGGYSRNGEITGLKPVDLTRVIGYVIPRAV